MKFLQFDGHFVHQVEHVYKRSSGPGFQALQAVPGKVTLCGASTSKMDTVYFDQAKGMPACSACEKEMFAGA